MAKLLTKTRYKTWTIQTNFCFLGSVWVVDWFCTKSVRKDKMNPQKCNQNALRGFHLTTCHLNLRIACLDAQQAHICIE